MPLMVLRTFRMFWDCDEETFDIAISTPVGKALTRDVAQACANALGPALRYVEILPRFPEESLWHVYRIIYRESSAGEGKFDRFAEACGERYSTS